MNISTEAWNVADQNFPMDGTCAEKLEFLLNYAILAPSTHNTQPWLFRLDGDGLELYADRTRSLRCIDPLDRELIMSCSAALFHLRIAMLHFGYLGDVQAFPDPDDPDLLARIRLGFRCESYVEECLLFNSIRKRHTNRQPFKPDVIPDALLAALENAVEKEGAWLHIVTSEDERFDLSDLVAESDRIQWASKRFRLELAAWTHPNRSACRDGIPGYAYGHGALVSMAEPLLIRTFNTGPGHAARDRDIALYSPVLAVLGTSGDEPEDWVVAGQALARLLLRARVEDVASSFLNQAIEVPQVREKMREVIRRAGYPQALVRLGFSTDGRPTPRRPVTDILIRF